MQIIYFICMRIFAFALLFFCLDSFAAFVAVLETIAIDSAITPSECHFLTDELRAQAGVALPPYMNYTIMTRENINVMLPPGKALEDCEGTCLAETGRNISADYVAQARVGRFGDNLTLTVELYETGSAKLLGSYTALQPAATDLWNDIKRNSKTLFARIQDMTRNLGGYSARIAQSPVGMLRLLTRPQRKRPNPKNRRSRLGPILSWTHAMENSTRLS